MNRNGDVIKIVQRRPFYSAEYMDEYSNSYYPDGAFRAGRAACYLDLIEEIKGEDK